MPTLREFLDAVKVVNAFADKMKDFVADLQKRPVPSSTGTNQVVRTAQGNMPKGSWPRAIITALETMNRPLRVVEITQAIADVRNVPTAEVAQTVRNAIHDLKVRGFVLHDTETGTYRLPDRRLRRSLRQERRASQGTALLEATEAESPATELERPNA